MKRLSLFGAALACTALVGGPVEAQGFFKQVLSGFSDDTEQRRLVATIWVDPDGCEHWVMDDGLEGYMSAHLDKHGKPVCRVVAPPADVCASLAGNTTFSSGSANIRPSVQSELRAYFEDFSGKSIVINGHTDSNGSDAANMALSLRRAVAVAQIAENVGVIAEPRGFGEAQPVASNDTASGRSQNRRVDLSCS